jgi:hypothetical protein
LRDVIAVRPLTPPSLPVHGEDFQTVLLAFSVYGERLGLKKGVCSDVLDVDPSKL